MSTTEGDPTSPQEQIDDANDLRGFHFKQLLGKARTWVWVVGGSLLLGIGFAVLAGAAAGGVVFLIALLVALGIVFVIADSKAADSFFAVYAEQRNLTLGGRTSLPSATPLLRKGNKRYAERTLEGTIAEGVDGMLALYTYEEESRDSKGNKQTNYYRYTVGLLEVPECAQMVPELYCQRKFGFRALEKFEDAFRGSKKRIRLESEALDRKYEIFADESQDANWLRQLFAPTFIVWLTDSAPKKFAFELVDGTLCAYVNGHKDNAADLEEIGIAAAAVAKRLRDEALE